jgi:hypothetical protein
LKSYKVDETYLYGDIAGRRTKRTTQILQREPPQTAFVLIRSIDQTVAYNEFGELSTIEYPFCYDCAEPPGGAKNLSLTRSAGRITAIPGYVTSIAYAGSGAVSSVVHANGVTDTYEYNTQTGLPRPTSIAFVQYGACDVPSVASQPADQTIPVGQNASLTVIPGGTGPFSYQWYEYPAGGTGGTEIPGATGQTLMIAPTTSKHYFVRITNSCSAINSPPATVTVEPNCVPPQVTLRAEGLAPNSLGPGDYIALSGTPITLSADRTGTVTLTYAWYRQDPGGDVLLGTQAPPMAAGVITRTTTFRLRISNGCPDGTVDKYVTVRVPLPSPSFLTAVKTGPTQITVTWGASTGASHYKLERRTVGTPYVEIATLPAGTLSYIDNACVANQTYGYRVRATADPGYALDGSLYSRVDLATTMNFTTVTSGSLIQLPPLQELLAALNSMRAAIGWATVQWQHILPAGVPAPGPGVAIHGAHITSLRREMNNALQAFGAFVPADLDSDLAFVVYKPGHITELQQRAQ